MRLSAYLCIWISLELLCRTVLICRTVWLLLHLECVLEVSEPGLHEEWLTEEKKTHTYNIQLAVKFNKEGPFLCLQTAALVVITTTHTVDTFIMINLSCSNSEVPPHTHNKNEIHWMILVKLLKSSSIPNLTPHQHAPKHNLQTIKEVLADNDHHRSTCGPALTGADGFDTWGGCLCRKIRKDRHHVSVLALKHLYILYIYMQKKCCKANCLQKYLNEMFPHVKKKKKD